MIRIPKRIYEAMQLWIENANNFVEVNDNFRYGDNHYLFIKGEELLVLQSYEDDNYQKVYEVKEEIYNLYTKSNGYTIEIQ